LRETVLPGAEQADQAMNEGYDAGRFSYVEVSDTRRTLNVSRIQYVQALTDYHKAVADIEALTGRAFAADVSK